MKTKIFYILPPSISLLFHLLFLLFLLLFLLCLLFEITFVFPFFLQISYQLSTANNYVTNFNYSSKILSKTSCEIDFLRYLLNVKRIGIKFSFSYQAYQKRRRKRKLH